MNHKDLRALTIGAFVIWLVIFSAVVALNVAIAVFLGGYVITSWGEWFGYHFDLLWWQCVVVYFGTAIALQRAAPPIFIILALVTGVLQLAGFEGFR